MNALTFFESLSVGIVGVAPLRELLRTELTPAIKHVYRVTRTAKYKLLDEERQPPIS